MADYETLRRELGAYDPALLERPEIVVLSKADLVAERAKLAPLVDAFRARGRTVLCVSGATGEGVPELVRAMLGVLDASDAADAAGAES